MGWAITKQDRNYVEISVDTADDLAGTEITQAKQNWVTGSNALIIDTAEVYALKSDKTWKKL